MNRCKVAAFPGIMTMGGVFMETGKPLALIIKEARENASYTQEQLSSMIGKSEKYIGAVECGRISPPFPVLKKIVLTLNLDGNLLFYENDDSANSSVKIAEYYLRSMGVKKRKLALELLRVLSKYNEF